ncbi:MAG: hypothetical protein RL385_834, partial [Pseudomonadota bacterium]
MLQSRLPTGSRVVSGSDGTITELTLSPASLADI